jgi:16S rRNA (adenine1518-N6/adenine1519-N6)-dimethyltransferase
VGAARHPRALLAARGLRPKKRFGQHFLADEAIATRIARLAKDACSEPAPRMIEIGAGTGTLSAALVREGFALTALEVDRDLVAILFERQDLRGAEIVEADALAYDYQRFAATGIWHVCGNLPYNVGTPLVTRFAEMNDGPRSMTVMVQRDVARRLAAKPATPQYGSLSVAVQYAMHVRLAFTLGPRAFYPAPKVESTVVQMIRREEPAVRPKELALFRKVVRAAFAYRRKTLANSLALALRIDRRRAENAIRRAGIPTEQRGERLDLADFARLADALAEG